jgi:starch synthase
MPEPTREVVMVASENDALKGGKVGGVGDVVRDLPRALARVGLRVTVIVPSYGFLHKNNPARLSSRVQFPFAGTTHEGELWEVTPKRVVEGVTYLVFEHAEIRGNPIYCHDPPGEAFAQDASKYALFCSAVGRYLLEQKREYVLHLHDWHTGALLLLRELHPEFTGLKRRKTVFTIHNVAIQGTRPIRGKLSSVEQWFPELFGKTDWISRWKDPRYPDPTFTPMAAGIRHADRVNTVSPTYAHEILVPSDPSVGFIGGEGLESFLAEARDEGRLFGILNGCEYPERTEGLRMPLGKLCALLETETAGWKERKGDPSRSELVARIHSVRDQKPAVLLTSVTRVVDQKVRLLVEKGAGGMRAIDTLLSILSKYNGAYLLLGTGTSEYEDELMAVHRENENFLYLRGYSESIGEVLYANGSLFVMPSLFEPCGISQMLAMREGQPCVVHAVGGLKDTVSDGVNGFQFTGASLSGKVDAFIDVMGKALRLHSAGGEGWSAISAAAARARFTWEGSARKYVDLLYS